MCPVVCLCGTVFTYLDHSFLGDDLAICHISMSEVA